MRALVLDGFDTVPTVREVPDPVAGAGEVLVRIAAASVNPFDRFLIAGGLKAHMEHHFPIILGRDYAGTVEAVGDGVEGADALAVGDRVFGTVTKALGPGSIAERIAAPAARAIARLPESVDFLSAAALGLAGTAAMSVVNAVDPQPGQTILVSGATGGVGTLAVQLVAARGATVIATAGSDEGRALVRSLGADDVVDRTGDIVAQVRAIAPNGVDAIVHLAGDGNAQADALVPGGRIASITRLDPDSLEGRPITALRVTVDPAYLATVADLAARGVLRAQIQRVLDLDEAPRAYAERIMTLGKTVIRIA